MEREVNGKKSEKGMEILGECLAGLLYSDEEIRATMAQEDADEFIALRNEFQDRMTSPRCYGNDDVQLPLAAEEECEY